MISSADNHPVDDLAAYALDALDPAEARAVEAHVAVCPGCRQELDAYRETMANLVEDEPAPPAVWDRIAQDIAPAHLDTARQRRRTSPPLWAAAAAAAVALIAGIGIGLAIGSNGSSAGVDDNAERALDETGSTVAPLMAPEGDEVARLVLTDDADFVLLDELDELPTGQAYQLWHLGEDEAVSLGMLGDGTWSAVQVIVPPGATTFAITSEPADGVVAATGPIVAQGSLSAPV